MGSLEDRLRKLEEQIVLVPTIDEYLDASNREEVRALHTLAERLEKFGFNSGHIFTEANRRMQSADTQERRERDREIVEAWYKAQGKDRAAEVEGARERLLARLESRSKT
jgi:hypothetical protein